MPIYADSFIYYRLYQIFWYITRFVIPGDPVPHIVTLPQNYYANYDPLLSHVRVHRSIVKIPSNTKVCIKHRYASTLGMTENNLMQNLLPSAALNLEWKHFYPVDITYLYFVSVAVEGSSV